MLLKNIILTTFLLAISSNLAVSQNTTKDTVEGEIQKSSLTINENNLECFQTLHCLKRENLFKNSNLNDIRLNDNRSSGYIVEGSSKSETLHAVYNNSGELIKATVIQRNIVLPRTITETLTSDDYKSWFIIGNELTIENFDKERMQFKVILQQDDEVRVEYFDRNGQVLNRIS